MNKFMILLVAVFLIPTAATGEKTARMPLHGGTQPVGHPVSLHGVTEGCAMGLPL